MNMYAIVKTGGKQYRVEEGQSLLVERLPASDGDSVDLQPLLCVDGSNVVDGDGLSSVSVVARVVGHERGPKLRVVKFKPKRGYKRRTGHRQELTRLEVTGIKMGGGGRRSSAGKAAGSSSAGEAEASSSAGKAAGSSSAGKAAASDQPAAPKPVAADKPRRAPSGEGAEPAAPTEPKPTETSNEETENGA
jgi:large subunit ribosomal protein L21